MENLADLFLRTVPQITKLKEESHLATTKVNYKVNVVFDRRIKTEYTTIILYLASATIDVTTNFCIFDAAMHNLMVIDVIYNLEHS